MRAEEAKVLSDNVNELKETFQTEISKIYEEIKASALSGFYSTRIYRGYLNRNDCRNKYLEQTVIGVLESKGYSVSKHCYNLNNPFLLVCWVEVSHKHPIEAS